MIIKTWLYQTIIRAKLQICFAIKKFPLFVGLCIPIAFFGFTLYAWFTITAPLSFLTMVSFALPPFFLLGLYELLYWRQRWKERGRIS